MIGVGVFLLCVIMMVFVITHMIRIQGDVESLELAAELGVILFAAFMSFFLIYMISSML